MKQIILLLLIAAIAFGCKDDEPEDFYSDVSGKYTGSIGFSNDNGLNSYEEGIKYTFIRNGNTATVTFHYADDTGDVTLQLTDLLSAGYDGDPAMGFKIEEQMAGEKIQHKFKGIPLGYSEKLSQHHGYIKWENQVRRLVFGTDVHTHYGDDMRMGNRSLKDLVQ